MSDFIRKGKLHTGAHPEFFLGGGGRGAGANREATYNLRLVLKIML
jgi:hypothetical protein